MRVLITGGAGFIGSHFIRHLLKTEESINVINFDSLTYAADTRRLEDIEQDQRYCFVKGDIRNIKDIKDVFSRGVDSVVHFAAQTHVDNSIKDPFIFEEVNIRGTLNLLDAAREYGTQRVIHVSCYDENTKALTTDGFKTYKELKKGDLVISLNPKTKEIEVKPIEKVIIQKYKGSMIHFKNKRIDLTVTPNHNMFILNTRKKLIVEQAQESSRRSIFYMPEGYWAGKNEEYFDVKGYGRVKTKDLMYVLGIFIGDGFIAYQEKEAMTKTGLCRVEYLKKTRDALTGRFKKIEKQGDHKSTMHSYRIFLDIPENDKCREKVKKTLSNMGITYRCHKGRAGTHLYFTSKIFMEFFAQCGQGAYNKCIPRWALDYSQEYLRCLFNGLMDSDGSRNSIYFTVSTRLVSDIVELCVKLGLKPNIKKRHSISYIGSRKIEGGSYCISVGKTKKSIGRHRIKKIDYDGIVWCLKVKDNKNFIVERNGKIDFCGNTDEVYGEIEEGAFSEESPLAPNSPYSASKAAADFFVRAWARTYGLAATIVRPCNNYGPWQYPEKFMPVIIYKALRGEKVPVYGKGLNMREWLYVADCARAIGIVLDKGEAGEIYNIGSGIEKRNIDTVKEVLKALDKPQSLIEFVKDRPGHDLRYCLDFSKVRGLGFEPEFDFEKGITELLEWSKDNFSWIEDKAKELQGRWRELYIQV